MNEVKRESVTESEVSKPTTECSLETSTPSAESTKSLKWASTYFKLGDYITPVVGKARTQAMTKSAGPAGANSDMVGTDFSIQPSKSDRYWDIRIKSIKDPDLVFYFCKAFLAASDSTVLAEMVHSLEDSDELEWEEDPLVIHYLLNELDRSRFARHLEFIKKDDEFYLDVFRAMIKYDLDRPISLYLADRPMTGKLIRIAYESGLAKDKHRAELLMQTHLASIVQENWMTDKWTDIAHTSEIPIQFWKDLFQYYQGYAGGCNYLFFFCFPKLRL